MAKNKPDIGRPPKEINWDKFETACDLLATKDEICGLLNVSDSTLSRHVKQKYDSTFEEVLKSRGSSAKVSLRRIQFKLAEKSAGMAIFLGKNYLGQKDTHEIEGGENLVDRFTELASYLKQSYTTSGTVPKGQSQIRGASGGETVKKDTDKQTESSD